MSAAAGAAAIAAGRRGAAQQERRDKAKRELAKHKYGDAMDELSHGPLDFSKALKALQAKDQAEKAQALRARPSTDALHDGSLRPDEVVGRSGKVGHRRSNRRRADATTRAASRC